MNKKHLVLAVAVVCATAFSVDAASTSRPNVVLMFVDNVGYGDLGCYGNLKNKTPAIDRFARQSVRCTDFYIGSPSCMPSRGALLTGRHPLRNGLNEQLYKIDELVQIALPHSERLLPEYLKPLGYATACFGKWNLGFASGSRPTERGFDEFFGHASGNMDYYSHIYNGRNDLFRGVEEVRVDGYSTDLIADAACGFIRRHAGRPFFAYVPFNAAHYANWRNKRPGQPVVWQAPDEYLALYGASPDATDPQVRYRAVISALDAGIGRVLGEIDRCDLTSDTLVIVLSDNGAFMIPRRGLGVASNLPLRSGGSTLYEGGVRVPCLVRWPGRIEPGSICREMLVTMDLVPMIVHAAGGELPQDRVFDGRDPTKVLAGEASSAHEMLCFQWGRRKAIRAGRYKFLSDMNGENMELYDLENDLGEIQNLAGQQVGLVSELCGQLDRWLENVVSDK